VDGPDGKRRRFPGEKPPGLKVEDETILVAPIASAAAAAWLKEDPEAPKKGGETGPSVEEPPTPPPSASSVEATTWEKAIEYAEERPLKELRLIAGSPMDAAAVLGLASSVGPDVLTLSVTAGGSLKDGGNIQLAIDDIKPSHPLKPLTIAATVINSINSGATYQAALTMLFNGDGRDGMADAIRKVKLDAPDGVSPKAKFGKPTGG
jgi:hypothetical protein